MKDGAYEVVKLKAGKSSEVNEIRVK